jgi:hypothetical protein
MIPGYNFGYQDRDDGLREERKQEIERNERAFFFGDGNRDERKQHNKKLGYNFVQAAAHLYFSQRRFMHGHI